MSKDNEGLMYSPLHPKHYIRVSQGAVYGVGREFSFPNRRAQWNLFWLSEPNVDRFLDDTARWQTAQAIDMEVFKLCFKCVQQKVGGRSVKDLLLTVTPGEFVAHVKAHDHEHLVLYQLLGAEWIACIERRAQSFRGAVESTAGGVVHASFGKKPQDGKLKVETKPPSSISIMTIASQDK